MKILPSFSGWLTSTSPHGGAKASASTHTGSSTTGPRSELPTLSSRASSALADAPDVGRNARLPWLLKAGPSHDTRTEEPHVLPPADRLDAEIWTQLPAAMKRFAVARTRQGLALRAQFGAELAAEYKDKGNCMGMTATWIRLHQAASGSSSAADRVNVVGSFEGMAQARIYQNAYAGERDALLGISSDGKLARTNSTPLVAKAQKAARRAAEKDPTSMEAMAQQAAGQAWGMEVGAVSKRRMNLEKTAAALADFSGYGMLAIRMHGGNHVGAIHREAGSDSMSYFDPDLGEFHFPMHEAKSFFMGFSQHQASENAPVIGFELMNVKMQEPIENTPLASLARVLANR